MRLEKITSKDKIRPTLNHIYLHKDRAVATDGHKLGVVLIKNIFQDCEEFLNSIPNEGVFIHPEDWKKIKDVNTIEPIKNGVIKIIPNKGRAVLIEAINASEIGKFPVYDNIIPSGTLEATTNICFNYKYLYDLCEAIGINTINNKTRLQFFGEMKAIRVDHENGNYGVIMPIRDV